MIDATAAQTLSEQLKQVEDRLGRLLTSGWRQARSEAAELRHEADTLVEAGLPGLGARLVAVAEAGSSDEALRAIALATSACRLLRARLPAHQPPNGWTPLTPATRSRATRTEALLPISRLLLDGHEVWVCTRPTRNEILLVERPFPEQESLDVDVDASPATPRLFGRLLQQMTRILGEDTEASSFWLRRRLSGTLRWQAQYPVGIQGDIGYYALVDPSWVAEPDGQDSLHHVRQALATNSLQDGASLFWTSGGFRVRQLDRDDAAAYVWLDSTAAEVFSAAPHEKPWAIVWLEGAAIVPVALVTPAGRVSPARLTHLIPGAPEDVLTSSG